MAFFSNESIKFLAGFFFSWVQPAVFHCIVSTVEGAMKQAHPSFGKNKVIIMTLGITSFHV